MKNIKPSARSMRDALKKHIAENKRTPEDDIFALHYRLTPSFFYRAYEACRMMDEELKDKRVRSISLSSEASHPLEKLFGLETTLTIHVEDGLPNHAKDEDGDEDKKEKNETPEHLLFRVTKNDIKLLQAPTVTEKNIALYNFGMKVSKRLKKHVSSFCMGGALFGPYSREWSALENFGKTYPGPFALLSALYQKARMEQKLSSENSRSPKRM